MSNSLKLNDISIRTMIGQLPKIINDNNTKICDYIDKIYDSSSECITKNVDNISDNKSYVKSNLGQFNSIFVGDFNLYNIKSLEQVIKSGGSNHEGINHDALNGRYLYKDNDNNSNGLKIIPNDKIAKDMKYYAHNSGAIGVTLGDGKTVQSLSDILEQIIKSVDKLKEQFSKSYSEDEGYIGLYGASNNTNNQSVNNSNSFTFDQSLLFATKLQLKRMNLPQYQYNDITQGFIYTYYDYANTVTINDENTSSIKGIPGSIVKLRFNDTKSKGFYRVILSREEKKFLRISKDELNRITLKCISNDEQFGASWDVLDYSVRSADDIMIERK